MQSTCKALHRQTRVFSISPAGRIPTSASDVVIRMSCLVCATCHVSNVSCFDVTSRRPQRMCHLSLSEPVRACRPRWTMLRDASNKQMPRTSSPHVLPDFVDVLIFQNIIRLDILSIYLNHRLPITSNIVHFFIQVSGHTYRLWLHKNVNIKTTDNISHLAVLLRPLETVCPSHSAFYSSCSRSSSRHLTFENLVPSCELIAHSCVLVCLCCECLVN